MVDGSGLHLQSINKNHIHKADRYEVATHIHVPDSTILCTCIKSTNNYIHKKSY